MVKWIRTEPVDHSFIQETESVLGIKFPMDYIDCVLKNNGGKPRSNSFDFEGRQGGLLVYLTTKKTIQLIL